MNILAIGANYDDIETGCEGTLVKFGARGKKYLWGVRAVSISPAPDAWASGRRSLRPALLKLR